MSFHSLFKHLPFRNKSGMFSSTSGHVPSRPVARYMYYLLGGFDKSIQVAIPRSLLQELQKLRKTVERAQFCEPAVLDGIPRGFYGVSIEPLLPRGNSAICLLSFCQPLSPFGWFVCYLAQCLIRRPTGARPLDMNPQC
jgi:hypothetical protein